MKKIIVFLLVNALVICGLGVNASNIGLKLSLKTGVVPCDDEIDQFQTDLNEGIPVGNFESSEFPRRNWIVSQSFVPSKEVLTRVKLILSRNTMPPTVFPLNIGIRNSLGGKDLVQSLVEPENVPEFPEYSMIEFDFEDIRVSVGKTYYIVASTKNATDNAYVWGVNLLGGYDNGGVYVSWDDEKTWREDLYEIDTCFITYGRDNSPPYPPTITGPTTGKAGEPYGYDFTAYDPDGDNMTYYVDWGDNTVDQGFVPSDGGMTLAHIWTKKGTYTIKAKLIDPFGAESDWGTLVVSMPKNKAIDRVLIHFLERYSPMLAMLKHLLPLQFLGI